MLAWYPGQRGGTAVADVLFGDANPGGRLPVTFYKGTEQLPAFDDYDMGGRTYRYFKGEPLYPFGFGLSYTHFTYSDLTLDRERVRANGKLQVTVQVKNSGERAGDEVVQLYLRGVNTAHARANRDLRGFQRVNLAPGETRKLTFEVSPNPDLRVYDDNAGKSVVDPGTYEVQVGASSADTRHTHTFTVR
jgi:beta-glucosidase